MTEKCKYFTVCLTGLLLILEATIGRSQNTELSQECYKTDNDSVCFHAYTDRSSALKPWQDAEQLCRTKFGGTLPLISSIEVQFLLAKFLWDKGITTDSVWLGARGFSTDWYWVDGQLSSQGVTGENSNFHYAVAVITAVVGNATLKAKDISDYAEGYICEYSDQKICSDYYSSYPKYPSQNSCFVRFDENLNWFSARNKCLFQSGDLAKMQSTNSDALNFTLNSLNYQWNSEKPKTYWVGLKKIEWIWNTINSDGKEQRMTFFVEQPSVEDYNNANGNCLVVNYNKLWAWSIRNCSINFHTVCQNNSLTVPPSTNSSQPATVSLPVWAVGVICGIAGLFYILSLIAIGLIVFRCCRKEAKNIAKTTTSTKMPTNRNGYIIDNDPPRPSTVYPRTTNADYQDYMDPPNPTDDYDEFDDDPSNVYANRIG